MRIAWLFHPLRRRQRKRLRKFAFRRLADIRLNEIHGKKFRQLWRANAVFSSSTILLQNMDSEKKTRLECGYEHEEIWKARLEPLLPYTMVTYAGLMSLVAMVRHVQAEKIPGDFVEAGTWRGGAAALMARAALDFSGPPRHLHLFDSFVGIPEPDRRHDPLDWIVDEMKLPVGQAQGRLRSIGALTAPRKDLEHILFEECRYPRDRVSIHEGWFQDTVPKAASKIERIALLRLDGDLYASTKVCLENLYDRLSTGGFLVIDDWCLRGARKAVEEFLASCRPRPFGCLADATVRYFIKP